jgi:hypothetical protein
MITLRDKPSQTQQSINELTLETPTRQDQPVKIIPDTKVINLELHFLQLRK